MKSRAATAMDRCEFLQTTRNKFTEFRAKEAGQQGNILRSKSNPIMGFNGNLGVAVTRANRLLDERIKEVSTVDTRKKRMEAMNKYVVDAEMKRGKAHGEAARSSASNTMAVDRAYPVYDEIHNLTHEAGM